MTQISRPFQIVLAVFAVFVVVWFAALRNHALSTGSGAGSSPAVVKPVKPAVKPAVHTTSASPTAVAHAKSVHARAGRTVAHTSRHTTSVHTDHGHTTTVHTTVHRTVVAHAPARTSTHSSAPPSAAAKTPVKPAPAKPVPVKTLSPQAQVESQLKAGKTVLILFWNPHGAEDVAVHGELPAVQHKLGGKVAVHYATAGQVGQYGTVTHSVQVNQTPTLLIVNPHGQATVLTGLTDAFAIEQAVRESNP